MNTIPPAFAALTGNLSVGTMDTVSLATMTNTSFPWTPIATPITAMVANFSFDKVLDNTFLVGVVNNVTLAGWTSDITKVTNDTVSTSQMVIHLNTATSALANVTAAFHDLGPIDAAFIARSRFVLGFVLACAVFAVISTCGSDQRYRDYHRNCDGAGIFTLLFMYYTGAYWFYLAYSEGLAGCMPWLILEVFVLGYAMHRMNSVIDVLERKPWEERFVRFTEDEWRQHGW